MKMLPVSEIVLDFDLYPRQSINTQHVTEMCEAAKAGVDFPPVVIDRKSKRLTDGFHRHRKAIRLKESEIAVVEKTYKNEAEMLLDAIRMNANHGRVLTTYDRSHCIILAGRMKITDNVVATAMSITTDRLKSLRIDRTATVKAGRTIEAVPLKRTVRHMAGRKLTKAQVVANAKLSGMNQQFYVNQLLTLITSGMLDREDEKLMGLLVELRDKITEIV